MQIILKIRALPEIKLVVEVAEISGLITCKNVCYKFIFIKYTKPDIYLPVLTFNLRYFTATVILFITEVLIALYVHDSIIRPYIGDLLVVILICCFVRSFFRFSVRNTAVGVLLFSYATEIMQYFHVVTLLGLQHSRLVRILIGTSFSWEDIIAYTAGIIIVLWAERKK